MATNTSFEELHDGSDEEDSEEEEEGGLDVSDIQATPSKALKASTFKDRVFIFHSGEKQLITDMKIVSIPHPTKGMDTKYFIYNKKLLEIQRMIDEPSSWFIDDNVEKDGSLYLATPVDPLFLALPILEKSRRKTADHEGYFSDHLFTSEVWTEIEKDVGIDLTQVCDEKVVGDDIHVYRLNDTLTVNWLRKKVIRIMAHIRGDTTIVPTGTSTVSTFVRAQKSRPPSEAETFNAAIGFLSEYVSLDWISAVKSALEPQIPATTVPVVASVVSDITPGMGRSMFDDDEDENDKKRKRAAASAPKTSAKANQLAAASKGNTVISSFFAPKKK